MGKSVNFFNAKLAAIVRRKVKWANRAVLGHAYQGYYGKYQPQKRDCSAYTHARRYQIDCQNYPAIGR